MIETEVWKDIKGYEGFYKVSSFGQVKSLGRVVGGKNGVERNLKERILKPSKDGGRYFSVNLYKEKPKRRTVHQLVAMEFLDHIPCGHTLVINHKNFNIYDNSVDNLEIVTQRYNSNLKHRKSSSKYTGVSWFKAYNKWQSSITINGKSKHLGFFDKEIDASQAYENKLKELNEF